MARTKGHRQKAGTLRTGIYIVLILALISIIVLVDAMSEEIEYDANAIKYGAAGVIVLIFLVDMFILSKPGAETAAAAPMRGPRPVPGPRPAPKRPAKRPAKKTPPRPKKKKAPKAKPKPRPSRAEVEEEVEVEEEYDTLEMPKTKPSRYAAELKDLQETRKPRERKIVSYPPEVRGGKYGDCFVLIDKYTVLKVRTLLAKAEELPEEEEVAGYDEYAEEGYDDYAGEDYGEDYADDGYDDGYDDEYADDGYGDEDVYSGEEEGYEEYEEDQYPEEDYEEEE